MRGHKSVIMVVDDITESKQAEEQQRLLSTITENMSEGVYLVRMSDGIIVYTNPRFEKLFGYDLDEMVGKHVSIVNAPTEKDPEETAKEIMAFIDQHGHWQGEIENIKKDGMPFWCYASVSAFDHPQHGRVIATLHTDITERKQAEEERKIQLSVEQLRAEFLTIETEGELLSATNRLHSGLQGIIDFNDCGVNIVDLDNRVFTTYVVFSDGSRGSDTSALPPAIEEAVATQIPVYRANEEDKKRYKDLNPQPRSILDVPFLGGTIAINSLEEDAFSERDIKIITRYAQVMSEGFQRLQGITERKQAEETLREKERQWHLFSLATSNMLWNWNFEDDSVERNIVFEITFGYSNEEVTPTISWSVHHEAFSPML